MSRRELRVMNTNGNDERSQTDPLADGVVPSTAESKLIDHIERTEQRKLKSRREGSRGIWFGLGMFGVIGWSIALPTLLGIAIGIWLDKQWPGKISCTLTCLFLGVVAGCWIAWYWVKREMSDES